MSLSEQIQRVDGSQNTILKAVATAFGLSTSGKKIDTLASEVAASPKFASGAVVSASTLSSLGLASNKTANDAFVALKNLITGLQTQVGGLAKMAMSSYAGTGTFGSANPNTITFPFAPKLVIFLGDSDDGTSWNPLFDAGYAIFVPMDFLSTDFRRQNPPWVGSTLYDRAYSKKSADGKTLSWYVNSATASGQLNNKGRTYWYAALG